MAERSAGVHDAHHTPSPGSFLYLATSGILPEAHTPRRAADWTLTTIVLETLFMWGVIGLTA
ncbi:hypothetical protein GCM10022224_102460 [Nonomuraea antimicrobica]|uniref:Uncharacterized protein n=1 Tax=Nonomuraea antimicrobica TaxID=561173 RepID=A0ABP7EPQ4_9ACTN